MGRKSYNDAAREGIRDSDLEPSGLADPKIIKKLGMTKVLDEAETEEQLGIKKALAYEIPYFAPDGSRLKFSRWKIIPVADALDLKYYQEAKSIPHVYLPPLVDWVKICADPSQRIVITEGEKKAACACLHGLPTMGLGGVWMHKATKYGLAMLRDFNWFDWREREVEICYDADTAENDDVRKAQDNLIVSLRQRGARVFVRLLPARDGIGKLDDFLVKRGREEYEELDCEEAGGSRELYAFNRELMFVDETKDYFAPESGIFYYRHEELVRRYGSIKIVGESGKPMRAIDAWVEWANRRMVRAITYEPGQPEIVDGAYNMWRPGPEPKRGDATPFLEVIREIENWRWFLQWLAYPLQHPGTKLFTAVLIWSREQGTGKSFIGRVMREIYGPRNSGSITSSQLAEKFNGWAYNKQFIVGEEVSDYAAKGDTHALKALITEPHVQVRMMRRDAFEAPNHVNFYFSSNEPAPLKIEDADRRFFVAALPKRRTVEFWKKLDDWRRDGGSAAFHYYLLTKVDCSDFDPQAAAPTTTEKRAVVYAGKTEVEQWCADLMTDPDMARPRGTAKLRKDQDVFSVDAIYSWYATDRSSPAPRHVFGRALRSAGAIGPSEAVLLPSGERRRMVAIRNLEKWTALRTVYKAWSENFSLGSPESKIERVLEKKPNPLKKRDPDTDGRLGARKVVPIGVSMRAPPKDGK